MTAFKTYRLRKEWVKLSSKNPRFYLMLINVFELFPTVPIVTNLWRSNAEQIRIYRNNAKFVKKPWRSVHELWRGCDVSIKNLTSEEIKAIVEAINEIYQYDKDRPTKKTAIHHDVGAGDHIHIQVNNS